MMIPLEMNEKYQAVKKHQYQLVKKYYDEGLWSLERVQKAVWKGWITPEEYKQITGKDTE